MPVVSKQVCHAKNYWNTDVPVVLSVTHLFGNDWHLCLLENSCHATWMTDFSPTSNVTFRSHRHILVRQADGGHISVELDGFGQLKHGNIVVQRRWTLIRLMHDHLLDLVFGFRSLSIVPVMFSYNDREIVRVLSSPSNTMSSSNNMSWSNDRSSTSWSTSELHQDLPWPRPTCSGHSSNHTLSLDGWLPTSRLSVCHAQGDGQSCQNQLHGTDMSVTNQ